jgi:phosphoglycolate phosphatase/AHBA synthesis associated protein
MSSEASPVLRAVLFDLDGVLVDSFESWFAVVNEAAVHFGAPPVDRPKLAELFGQGPEDDAIYLYPGQTADEVRTLYDELMPNEVARIRVGPESRTVLDDLGRRGLLRAVVTNTQASLARQILETADLLGGLDTWAGVGGGLGEKPKPDLLLAVLDRFGVPPSEALLVGDSRYDEEAAKNAGTRFVFFDLRSGGSLGETLIPHLLG